MADLWRVNLKRLQEQFGDADKRYSQLRCRIWHTDQSEQHRLNDSGFPGCEDERPVHCGSVGYGRTGATRHSVINGEARAFAALKDLAARAGRLVRQVPASYLRCFPLDTLQTENDMYRWLWLVFDCAWSDQHPSLLAERKVWVQPSEPLPDLDCSVIWLPYDVEQLRSLRASGMALMRAIDFPKEWTERLPGFYFSELSDVLSASVDALDVLDDLIPDDESKRDSVAAHGSGNGANPDLAVHESADATRRERLDALLGALADKLRGCIEFIKNHDRPDCEAIRFTVSTSIGEAARYMCEVGLKPSGIELVNRYANYFAAVTELAYCDAFRAYPTTEREFCHEELGLPKPEQTDEQHAEQQETRRTLAAGRAGQLLDYIAELRTLVRKCGASQGAGDASVGYEGFASADTLFVDHGIPKTRLSEGKKAGTIKTKTAPPGQRDSQGKAVRILYHIDDAVKNYSPKHVQERTRQNVISGKRNQLQCKKKLAP